MSNYDVVIIGSGPGGYTSAIRNAQLGKKVAMIEKYSTLGGTCLNVGCIPSKALLDSSEKYYEASQKYAEHGIEIGELKVDFEKMIARKDAVVAQTSGGINYLMDKNKITLYTGKASFVNATTLKIEGDKTAEITAKNIIIATGSKPTELPFAKFDKQRIISSTEALKLKEIPKSMLVIGGGVIGLEMGSVYSRLGTAVQVVEFADKILPTMDEMVSKEMLKVLKKKKVTFNLSTKVKSIQNKGNKVVAVAEDKKGKEVTLEAEYCLVSVGRSPYTAGLDLDKAGVELDEKGRIKVDANLRTSQAHIFAIGDVVAGPMLAHKAEEDGVFVAELLDGQKPHMDYDMVPGVVYTWPEAAGVGKTEAELKEAGVGYKVGKYSMKALGRARASEDTEGMMKVLADEKTDQILGIHMVCARAADIISEAAVAMEYKASAEDIGRICHAHPTFAEALKEASLDATAGRAINA